MTATMLRQTVVDAEFRAAVLADPAAFGLSATSLPAAVEDFDQESLDFWTEGAVAMNAVECTSSCSSGRFTIICDGGTK
ncbi:cinnamycin family lantibiotic [Streptomyces roseoverticillatus]|uniref:cinnamycin family lantibiotic n=1 Tax=Streptomyces roseoverticillatus TaxID=66429 RepID=UPI0004C0D4A4|nr:cinnamycin family lantibiotic [Streptomyces roseoverticillatus]